MALRAATWSATFSPSTATSRRPTWKITTSTFSSSFPARCRCRWVTSARRAIDCSASTTSTSPARQAINNCDALGIGTGCIAGSINDFTVPRNFGFPYGAAYIFQENSIGSSNYNSLQSQFRVTNYHGFTSLVNYVWSKSLDNSSDGEDFVLNAAQPQDSNNPQCGIRPVELQHPSPLRLGCRLRLFRR